MCNGQSKPASSTPPPAADPIKPSTHSNPSLLLDFAAANDLSAISLAVEAGNEDLSASSPWYCRLYGPNKMAFAERTPLMIAALYGSTDVLNYILHLTPQKLDVNQPSASDGATALHLAASGGSPHSLDAVRTLIHAGACIDAVDRDGRRPGDVMARQMAMALEGVLKAVCSRASSPPTPSAEEKRKEYPADLTLPDIKNGVYGTDEFRMFQFKIKPCSRAYSHDWTECPFVHPGENARRRDPRKYHYSCVPCPDHRKGSCPKGDGCEYAHGVFESWLHPAQYRTRLCKDVEDCRRRVCFFAHKEEELRPVSNGLALSPRSAGFSSIEMAAAAMMLSSSLMSPSAMSAGMGSPGAWMNQAATPPALQLPGSRLKGSMMSARDFDELLGLESSYQQRLLLDEIQIASASPRANWGASTPRAADYGNMFGGSQLISSPTMNSSSSSSMAKAIMNSRSSAFAMRSQSFIDRGAVARMHSGLSASPAAMTTTALGLSSDWGSPDRKVDWGIEREELNLLRKSASFAYRNNSQPISPPKRVAAAAEEPDFSWVQSLVRDGPAVGQKRLSGGAEMFSPCGEEQTVA